MIKTYHAPLACIDPIRDNDAACFERHANHRRVVAYANDKHRLYRVGSPAFERCTPEDPSSTRQRWCARNTPCTTMCMIGGLLALCVATVGVLSMAALSSATRKKRRRDRTQRSLLRMHGDLRETFEIAARHVEPVAPAPPLRLIVAPIIGSSSTEPHEVTSHAPSVRTSVVGLTAALSLLEQSSVFDRPPEPPTRPSRYPRASTPPALATSTSSPTVSLAALPTPPVPTSRPLVPASRPPLPASVPLSVPTSRPPLPASVSRPPSLTSPSRPPSVPTSRPAPPPVPRARTAASPPPLPSVLRPLPSYVRPVVGRGPRR